MVNRPIPNPLTKRKAAIGSMAGKTVLQARPTGRKRIDHRSFCDEVGHATTLTGAEVEAVLCLAAEIAKHHVENGDIFEFGNIGTLTPSFQSKIVEKDKTEFNPYIHITKPVVRFSPAHKYFTLSGVTYERVEAPAKKAAKTKLSGGTLEENP